MKRTLTALSLAAIAGLSFAGAEVTANPDVDRTLTTYPEIAGALYRIEAGQSEADAVVAPVAEAYRQNAGESDADNLVKNSFA
jgi:hypothetical protein